MARKPRFILPGVPQHVIQRGHNREPCFYSEQDYIRYLADVREAAECNQVAIHAYVLMTNHVHLLVTPGHTYGITHVMQDTGRATKPGQRTISSNVRNNCSLIRLNSVYRFTSIYISN